MFKSVLGFFLTASPRVADRQMFGVSRLVMLRLATFTPDSVGQSWEPAVQPNWWMGGAQVTITFL